MNTKELNKAIEYMRNLTNNPSIMEALDQAGETANFATTQDSLLGLFADAQAKEVDTASLPFDVSPVYAKHAGRPTEELAGMARNRRKELSEVDTEINTGDFLDTLVEEHKQAGEQKHEFTTAYADVLNRKKNVIDKDLRVANRRIYGAVAESLESGEFKLDKFRKNDEGEELSSYVLPAWLTRNGIDIQNAEEVVFDPVQLMAWVQMFNVWDVVSIDQKKLERFVKADNKARAGKNTAKFSRPVPAPVVILPKFKITVGEQASYAPPQETENAD